MDSPPSLLFRLYSGHLFRLYGQVFPVFQIVFVKKTHYFFLARAAETNIKTLTKQIVNPTRSLNDTLTPQKLTKVHHPEPTVIAAGTNIPAGI